MRILGVIDLAHGRAVHARGGDRARYAPVARVGGHRVDGDPVALAAAYRSVGVDDVYVADLDAIAGAPAQIDILAALAAAGLPLWVDAGVADTARAATLLRHGAAHVIVGLETLPSWQALADIASEIGSAPIAFSLDLHAGTPLVGPGVAPAAPATLASHALDAGASSIAVLDLARVGMNAGPDTALLRTVRLAVPRATLLAGGGVRDDDDLARLRDAGCDGVLVATALHTGRIHPSVSR